MPATIFHETAEHPAEGFRSVVLPGNPNRPLRVYLPTDYQPKYAYPLVVLFHADGECEEHAARLVPLLSRRNYVALCLRGGVNLGLRSDGRPAFGWGTGADRGAKAALAYTAAEYNIHLARLFLVGVGEGAAAAYRFGQSLQNRRLRASGVVALNAVLPTSYIPATDLRVLIGHGTANPVVPFADARRAAARLTAAGAAVRVNRYPTSHRVHADMLRDANRWIMTQIATAAKAV
jgi:phospholipase/carboxylesterase